MIKKQTRVKLKRKSKAWKQLVKDVFERDKYQCQICDSKFLHHMLAPHHIKSFGSGGSDEKNNLIPLCASCHFKIHNGEIILKKIKYKEEV